MVFRLSAGLPHTDLAAALVGVPISCAAAPHAAPLLNRLLDSSGMLLLFLAFFVIDANSKAVALPSHPARKHGLVSAS